MRWFGSCAGRTACIDEDREAQNLFNDFINCAAMQNCAGQLACQTACPQEFNTCQNGAVPNPDMGLPEPEGDMGPGDAGVDGADLGPEIIDEPIP